VAASNPISDRAMALAAGGDRATAVTELIGLAAEQALPLEEARDILVRRIRLRSDDYQATSGLSLINAALGQVGWADPMEWRTVGRRGARSSSTDDSVVRPCDERPPVHRERVEALHRHNNAAEPRPGDRAERRGPDQEVIRSR